MTLPTPSNADLLVAFATSQFDMKRSPDNAREEVVAAWRTIFGSEPELFAAAAAAVSVAPKPPMESAQLTAQLDPIRESLGAQTPVEAYVAMIAARDLLEQLALEYG